MGNRGFGSLTAEQRKAISSKGGKAAHKAGTAHKFTPEEAAAAGRKGGRSVSEDKDHMASIGRRGGASRQRQKEQQQQ